MTVSDPGIARDLRYYVTVRKYSRLLRYAYIQREGERQVQSGLSVLFFSCTSVLQHLIFSPPFQAKLLKMELTSTNKKTPVCRGKDPIPQLHVLRRKQNLSILKDSHKN